MKSRRCLINSFLYFRLLVFNSSNFSVQAFQLLPQNYYHYQQNQYSKAAHLLSTTTTSHCYSQLLLFSSRTTSLSSSSITDNKDNDNDNCNNNMTSDKKQQEGVEKQKKERINWIVRPATIEDRDQVTNLLQDSYSHLLKKDYDEDFLQKALPCISNANDELLTCGTWYVVEYPSDYDVPSRPTANNIVGCGGWTKEQPRKSRQESTTTTNHDDVHISTVPHLRHFATHPNITRKGIANAIWARTQKDIQKEYNQNDETNFPSLEVFSTLTAEPFYESLGFQTVKRMTVPISNDIDFPCILMNRDGN